MAPIAPPKKLELTELIDMLRGPYVEIEVGEKPDSKIFNLPKLVLCHYSPYFDRCFNGGFKEATEQKLHLPEDNVKFFEPLMNYMIQGKVPEEMLFGGWPTDRTGRVRGREIWKWEMTCVKFMEYSDKYGLGAIACDLLYSFMDRAWRPHNDFKRVWACPPAEAISAIFRFAPAGHPLRALAVSGACYKSIPGPHDCDRKTAKYTCPKECLNFEQNYDGFAAEMVLLLRSEINKQKNFIWSSDLRYDQKPLD
ncbi:POZ [Glarea lozoyensis ATCC 20868]|uniref:POZ n=1 Tax=Glarea lozoyensis (strain ATCC 20868 / MF5171) TaxID=1116229 RepID=S3CM73_GLAL2|nr:POZ [Glarea lozoyensis ATCC 20868]EPE27622.1 POZ [Glarea lozoyensis ATCC 20868]